MMFDRANVVPLCPVDVTSLVEWITAIPFESWPQQKRLGDGQIRPAMVNDSKWHGFGSASQSIVRALVEPLLATSGRPHIRECNRMLSVVMPGHSIPPHRDRQPPGWICRVHVPLVTSRGALFVAGNEEWAPDQDWDDDAFHLEVGTAYAVNVQAMHWIKNRGDTPRIHFMFDVMEAK